MKLVQPDSVYDVGKTDLSAQENELAKAVFTIIQAFRKEVSEHDEDPGFDWDDAMSVIMKNYGFGNTLISHFSADPNIAKSAEAIVHGVIRNLGVLEEDTETEAEPAG